jgi:WD40 repeat protein
MSESVTCPRGHQWQPSDDPAPLVLVCPVCGLSAEQPASTVQLRGQPNFAEQPTLPPESFSSTRDLADRSGQMTPYTGFERLKIPGYEILSELGRGGMGVVYLARQVKLNRLVALKMILSGVHAGAVESARFRAEAEVIAHLQHPNIVQIHAVDEHDGAAFLALEYVDGGSLAQKLANRPQPPWLAAHFLMAVARGVEAAHQAGIVHRDLKPGNILLARWRSDVLDHDSERDEVAALQLYGTPKITDFGLAKNLDHASAASVSGAILGTPSYMSPEQAEGRTREIGPAADVYALGAILYEMLTGRPPFQAATPLETVCQVVSDEPVRPTSLAPKVPRDLETICLKCLRKEPAKRYGSAAELADDLHRFLGGKPILARPTPWWERTWKWVRRHPAAAGLIAVSSIAAVVLVLGGIITNARLQRALDAAEAQGAETQRAMVRLHVANGVHRMDEGDGFSALVWFTEALRLDERRPERHHAHRLRIASVLRQCPRLADLWTHKGAVRTVQIGPDSNSVLSAGDDGARLWSLAGGGGLHLSWRLPHSGEGGPLLSAAFSPDGRFVVTANRSGAARLFQRSNGKALGAPLIHEGLRAVAFDKDGSTLATAGNGGVRLWTVSAGALRTSLKLPATITDVAFSPDGRLLAASGADGVVRLWHSGRWNAPAITLAHPAVAKIVFSSDSGRLLTVGGPSAVVWDVSTGRPVGPPLKHEQSITHADFSHDGRRIVTASEDGTARLWRVPEGELQGEPLKHKSVVLHAAFSPHGRWVATASDDNTARVWDAQTGRPVSPPLRHNGTVNQIAWSPDSRRLAIAADDRVVRVWMPPSGAKIAETSASGAPPPLPPRSSFGAGPDGLGAKPGPGFSVQIIDGEGRAVGAPLKGHTGPVLHAAFSLDGKRLITASADQTARMWDVASGQPISPPLSHASRVLSATFSPHGRRVLTTGEDNAARLWNAESGELLLPPLHHNGTVLYGAFSRDGLRLATVCKDRTVRVWDSRTGEALTPILQQPRDVRQAAFSEDDSQLMLTWPDGSTTTWDLSPEERPTEDLLMLSRLLASQEVDPRAGVLPVAPERIEKDWLALKQRYPESFTSEQKK